MAVATAILFGSIAGAWLLGDAIITAANTIAKAIREHK